MIRLITIACGCVLCCRLSVSYVPGSLLTTENARISRKDQTPSLKGLKFLWVSSMVAEIGDRSSTKRHTKEDDHFKSKKYYEDSNTGEGDER